MTRKVAILAVLLAMVATLLVAQNTRPALKPGEIPLPYPVVKTTAQPGDFDGLNYLAGREYGAVQKIAAKAVCEAHIKGDVPNISVSVPKRDEAGFAALVCFFEMSCALSAYASGVNPFDQPGVEAYKTNMFKMLGKE